CMVSTRIELSARSTSAAIQGFAQFGGSDDVPICPIMMPWYNINSSRSVMGCTLPLRTDKRKHLTSGRGNKMRACSSCGYRTTLQPRATGYYCNICIAIGGDKINEN